MIRSSLAAPVAFALCLLIIAHNAPAASEGAARMDRYQVTWESPGLSAADSMPVGNGDLAANVYVVNGALYLLLSKSDAFDGEGNLLKTGRIKVALSPDPFAGKSFRQTLDIAQGCILIRADDVTARIWVDANHPVYHIAIDSPRDLDVTAEPEFWQRLDKRQDQRLDENDTILWHRSNAESAYARYLKYYDIAAMADRHPDPYLNLTIGGLLECPGMKLSEGKLAGRGRSFNIRIHSLAVQTPDPAKYIAALRELAAKNAKESTWDAHRAWWDAFWDRSWIIASDNTLPQEKRELFTSADKRTGLRDEPDGGFVVSQHYNIARYMMACQSRGRCQTQFNGGLFTTPVTIEGKTLKEDERLWGRRFTFQNQRLLYWPMLAAGDFDLTQPYFNYYSSVLDLRKAITRAWFGHDGAYYRENVQLCGDEIDDSSVTHDKPPKTKINEGWYHNYHFTATLEMPYMMLQHVRYTGDAAFRDRVLLPMARECLLFYDLHYPRDNGKLRLDPSQVLETYWTAVNPATDIAGLQALLDGLLALDGLPEADRTRWTRLRKEIPDVPIKERDGRKVIAPAETCSTIANAENGELYPVFPFGLYGIGTGTAQLVRDTMAVRTAKDAFECRCWTQDQIDWACAGAADEAKAGLERRFRQYSRAMRFPVFGREGPDHVPDLDHNGAGSVALQKMIVQERGGKIFLLPAWPKSWDADFKLHASGGVVVRGRVKDGALVDWQITPESRRKDVVIGTAQ